MKKTEKIEIRVTPEEKEGLMDLARSEERSLSELIRSILGTYVETQTAKASTSKQGINHMFKSRKTLTIAGLLSSALAFATLTLPAQADGLYQITMDIQDYEEATGNTSTYNWSHKLKSSATSASPFIISADSGSTYEVSVALTEQEDASVFAQFSICKRQADICKPIAEPAVLFTEAEPATIKIGNAIETSKGEAEHVFDGISIQITHSDT